MNRCKQHFLLLFLLTVSIPLFCKSDKDTTSTSKKESFLDKLTLGNKKWRLSFLPVLGADPSSGFEFGTSGFLLFINDTLNRTSSVLPYVYRSTQGWMSAEIDVAIYRKSFAVKCNSEYNKNPERILYDGLDFKTGIVRKYIFASIVTKLFENSFMEFGANYDTYTVDTAMSTPEISLFSNEVFGVQMGIIYDTREHNLNPYHGSYAELIIKPQLIKPQNNFGNLFKINVKHFISLSKKTVLAMQFCSEHASKNTMYLQIPRLAGGYRMRGFVSRNKNLNFNIAYSQIELRQRLWWQIGAVAFATAGNSGYMLKDMNTKPIYSYGAGFRFEPVKKSRLNLRADFAFTTTGESAFYFGVNESF